jgi:hypothetical protein
MRNLHVLTAESRLSLGFLTPLGLQQVGHLLGSYERTVDRRQGGGNASLRTIPISARPASETNEINPYRLLGGNKLGS